MVYQRRSSGCKVETGNRPVGRRGPARKPIDQRVVELSDQSITCDGADERIPFYTHLLPGMSGLAPIGHTRKVGLGTIGDEPCSDYNEECG